MAGFVSLFLNHSREKLPNGRWEESLRLWGAQPTKSDPKFARIIIIVATTLVSRLSARGTTRFYIVCDTWHLGERERKGGMVVKTDVVPNDDGQFKFPAALEEKNRGNPVWQLRKHNS